MKKKFIGAIFVFITMFMLSGCVQSSNNLMIVNNSFFVHSVIFSSEDNKVTELIYTDFSKLDNATPTEKTDLIAQTYNMYLQEKALLEANYLQLLMSESVDIQATHQGKYVITVSTSEEAVVFKIAYQATETWSFFSSRDGLSDRVTYVYRFFTLDRIDGQEPVGSIKVVLGQDVLFGDYLKQKTIDVVEGENDTLLDNMDNTSAYVYVTSYRRRHSNADMIGYSDGYYYHQWNSTDSFDFEIFTTHARSEIWYLFALGLAFVIIGVMYLVSFLKPNKKAEQTEGAILQQIEEVEKELTNDVPLEEKPTKKPKTKKTEDKKDK